MSGIHLAAAGAGVALLYSLEAVLLPAQSNGIGFASTYGGSITPGTFGGKTITHVLDYPIDAFTIRFNEADLGASFLTGVWVNGNMLTSGSYDTGEGYSAWVWTSVDVGLVNGNTYPMGIF